MACKKIVCAACEAYVKAHSTRLQAHCGKTVDEYCQEKGRKVRLEEWLYY